MSYLLAFDPQHVAIRAEMRELRIPTRFPVGTMLFGLVSAASAASAVLSLAGL